MNNEVQKRGTIRVLVIVSGIFFVLWWFLEGFLNAIKALMAVWVGNLLLVGLIGLVYETDTVIEWLGKLRLQSSSPSARNIE